MQLTQPSVQGAMSSSLGEPGVAAGYFLEIHSGACSGLKLRQHFQTDWMML